MSIFLAQIGLDTIIYGIIIAFGILWVVYDVLMFHFVRVFVSISAFWLVFTMHGGTMKGGFAAAIAAPIITAGVSFIMLVMRRRG